MGYCKAHMKHCTLVILTLILSGFSGFSQLNNQIDKSQRESIKISPFETAKSMTDELKIQRRYRIQYIADINNIIRQFPNDTIILAENYDFICFGCPSDNVQVLVDTVLTNYERDFKSKHYAKTIEFVPKKTFSLRANQSDLFELRNEIWTNKYWDKQPEKYGTDKCFDGGHTFYTVIYPSGDMISMYMRCWVPKDLLKRTEGNNNP